MNPELIEGGDSGLLIVADHASAQVPAEVVLGIDPALLATHIAVDIGIAPLARRLAAALDAPALLAGVSRLVIDLNREEDNPGLIPEVSDGVQVPGNRPEIAERERRIARYYRPYHNALSDLVAAYRPQLLVSLHSFTPRLATSETPRPWQVGVLYNQDDRAPRIAIPLLKRGDVITGDNLPYSGRVLNATMNRHAEANGIPYLGLEVRQDLIADDAGVARWADILVPVIRTTRAALLAGAEARL